MAAILPDVFLLSVFRKLSANDRLSALQVCTNWYHRVREVNQALHCLTITVDCKSIVNENLINCYIFGYSPCMKQQLMREVKKEDGEHREELEYSTDWNSLQLSSTSTGLPLNYTTVQQIITAFPATTELNFLNSSNVPVYKCLVQMLESGKDQNNWTKQLKALRLIDMYRSSSLSETNNLRLFNAINQLPTLKRLVLNMQTTDFFHMTDWPVLARLKEICFTQQKDTDLLTLLQSLQRYAANNDDLRIDLPRGFDLLGTNNDNHFTFTLVGHVRERIVRLSRAHIYKSLPSLRSIFHSFSHLTSLSIEFRFFAECAPVFNIISQQLPHLFHLNLYIDLKASSRLNENDVGENGQIVPLLSKPLITVKALELNIHILSHSNLEWLNLPLTVPNVQAIHFKFHNCLKCPISFDLFKITNLQFQKIVRECFETSFLQIHSKLSIPLEKITIQLWDKTISVKQLLAQ